MKIQIFQACYGYRAPGGAALDPADYTKVFAGQIAHSSLEGIYTLFNLNPPDGYTGDGLTIADVIHVVEDEQIEPGFYYCDTYGFREVAFMGGDMP